MNDFLKKVAVSVIVGLAAEQVTKQIRPLTDALIERVFNHTAK